VRVAIARWAVMTYHGEGCSGFCVAGGNQSARTSRAVSFPPTGFLAMRGKKEFGFISFEREKRKAFRKRASLSQWNRWDEVRLE